MLDRVFAAVFERRDDDCDGRKITRHDQQKHDSAIDKTMPAMLKKVWNLACYSSQRENPSSESASQMGVMEKEATLLLNLQG